MLADPSARMFLKIGFSVLNTSSLSIPEPSWMHSKQAKEAAARCSSPLPNTRKKKKSQMIYEHKDKHALSLKHWNTCHLIDSNTFLVPFLRQRSILSVMVILLSEMNSYRMRVAIAVLSPSSAPCLVLALRGKKIYIYKSITIKAITTIP